MSKTTALTLPAIACCSLIAGTASATQPPDVVTSDSNGNTAMGSYVMEYFLTTGAYNTGAGNYSLYSISTGSENTAVGYSTLNNSNTASGDAAFGFSALEATSTGSYNTAIGTYALQNDSTGGWNTTVGFDAGGATTGNDNIAIGVQTLFSQGSGSNNIGIGYQTAYYLTGGSNNIDIGYGGASSSYSESNTIRIGQPGTQTATYVAGITGSVVTGAAVYVTSSGQLGVLASSERYKTDIKTIASRRTSRNTASSIS